MPKIIRSASSKTQRQREAGAWLKIAEHIERTGNVPFNLGICCAASDYIGTERSYRVVEKCFGRGWPFGYYGDREANEQRVIAATLLSLIVCTDQEPTKENSK